jgi:hypothetical protein
MRLILWAHTILSTSFAFFDLIELSFTKLAERLSFKPHRFVNVFFEVSFNSFASHGFSTDPPWKQTSLHTHGILAISDVACFFSPSAHYPVTSVKSCILGAFE